MVGPSTEHHYSFASFNVAFSTKSPVSFASASNDWNLRFGKQAVRQRDGRAKKTTPMMVRREGGIHIMMVMTTTTIERVDLATPSIFFLLVLFPSRPR